MIARSAWFLVGFGGAFVSTVAGADAPRLSGKVGETLLELTFSDSIRTPDFQGIRIPGYLVEHALFIEESDTLTFAPGFRDLTLPGSAKIVAIDSLNRHLHLATPPGWVPTVGMVLADTAHGGRLVRVKSVSGHPQGTPYRDWLLSVEPARLADVLMSGSLSFTGRLDWSTPVPAKAWPEEDAQAGFGYSEGGSAEAQAKAGQVRMDFKPMVRGRLVAEGGRIVEARLTVTGRATLQGEIEASAMIAGEQRFEADFSAPDKIRLPLGHGLTFDVAMGGHWNLILSAASAEFRAGAEWSVVQDIDCDIDFADGSWVPRSQIRHEFKGRWKNTPEGLGEFSAHFEPFWTLGFNGIAGPTVAFQPEFRLNLGGWMPPAGGASDSIAMDTASAAAWSDAARNSRSLHAASALSVATPTGFIGEETERLLVMGRREQPLSAPPRVTRLTLAREDSSGAWLRLSGDGTIDSLIVERLGPDGVWRSVAEGRGAEEVHVATAEAFQSYQFRVRAANEQGWGPAYPEAGWTYWRRPPPAAGHPQPSETRMAADTLLSVGGRLSWASGQGGAVLYNVYFGETNPPQKLLALGRRDTVLDLPDLVPGRRYFWKVVEIQGVRQTEREIRPALALAPDAFPEPEVPAEASEPETEALAAAPKAEIPPEGMALIPGGKLRGKDGRIRSIEAFYLQTTEVTQGEYRHVMGANPSHHLRDDLPVERVLWAEAAEYCRSVGGRLPTEAEWEYSARAGSPSRYFWGNGRPSEYAWFRENSDNQTQPVASLKPNAYGLYDMAGNVFEWVDEDAGETKVIRGASWYSEAANLDLSARFFNRPGFRNYKVGFRCAQDRPSEEAVGNHRRAAAAP